jgi:hypothetical protein
VFVSSKKKVYSFFLLGALMCWLDNESQLASQAVSLSTWSGHQLSNQRFLIFFIANQQLASL